LAQFTLHHIAVQTADLATSVAWYQAFFGAEPAWSLEEFSDLTRQRLPGITALTELRIGGLRIHLFGRTDIKHGPADPRAADFQHVCLTVPTPEELAQVRALWIQLHDSGEYAYSEVAEATEIVIDDDGVQSFYALDPNGLEFEISYVPAGHR
jgi:catechol 2,3-dioxygenase-like lactoylglutathione lyase family enzyme